MGSNHIQGNFSAVHCKLENTAYAHPFVSPKVGTNNFQNTMVKMPTNPLAISPKSNPLEKTIMTLAEMINTHLPSYAKTKTLITNHHRNSKRWVTSKFIN